MAMTGGGTNNDNGIGRDNSNYNNSGNHSNINNGNSNIIYTKSVEHRLKHLRAKDVLQHKTGGLRGRGEKKNNGLVSKYCLLLWLTLILGLGWLFHLFRLTGQGKFRIITKGHDRSMCLSSTLILCLMKAAFDSYFVNVA